MADVQPLAATPQPLTPDEESLVRALGQVMHALPRAIDADMVRDSQLPLTEYTALMNLSEAPGPADADERARRRCQLSLSGMTRTMIRLETQGLVRRDGARRTRAAGTPSSPTRASPAWRSPGPVTWPPYAAGSSSTSRASTSPNWPARSSGPARPRRPTEPPPGCREAPRRRPAAVQSAQAERPRQRLAHAVAGGVPRGGPQGHEAGLAVPPATVRQPSPCRVEPLLLPGRPVVVRHLDRRPRRCVPRSPGRCDGVTASGRCRDARPAVSVSTS